jgi:hypothetical protein
MTRIKSTKDEAMVTKLKSNTAPKLVQDAPPIVPAQVTGTSVPALATGTAVAAGGPPNYFTAFGDAANSGPQHPIIKFAQGDFNRGKEQEEIPLGTEMVVVMSTLRSGYIKWEDNRPVREDSIMGYVKDGFAPPRSHELPERDKSQWEEGNDGKPRDPYQFTNEVVFIDLKTGEPGLFSTSSKGGVSALGELAKAYGGHMRAHPEQFPVIALGVNSYQHSDRTIGRVKTPKFTIVRWVDSAEYLKALETAGE